MHPSACIVSQRYYDPKGQSRVPAGATYTGNVDSGTGVYIGDRMVLTASHVPEKDSGATTYVDFGSQRIKGRVVRRDKLYDLAVVQLQSTPRGIPLVSLANDDVKIGDHVSQSGKTTGLTSGNVSGFSSPPGGGSEWFIVNATAKSGDSGGPVLMNGRLVGIRWGGDSSGSRATKCSVIRRFLRGLLRPQSPSKSLKVLPKPPKVVHGKTGPEGPKGEPGAKGEPGKQSAECGELRRIVTANAMAVKCLTEKVESLSMKPGPPGPTGPPGPPGKDTNPTPPVSAKHHAVIVIDDSASWWDRMESELGVAKEHYYRISTINRPDYNVGVIPQFVIYQNGKAVRVVKGTYAVSAELVSISRGEHPILK